MYKTAEAIKLSGCGGKVTREPGPLPGINTKITACLDPDGWKTVCLFDLEDLICQKTNSPKGLSWKVKAHEWFYIKHIPTCKSLLGLEAYNANSFFLVLKFNVYIKE